MKNDGFDLSIHFFILAMAENRTMIQFFEWHIPDHGLHWKQAAHQAKNLAGTGFNMVWLPPPYKGAAGIKSVGYDVYDMYDLGEFDQKDTVRTKYGPKEDYLVAVRSLQANGIKVIADVTFDHKIGADETEKVMVTDVNPENRTEDIGKPHEIQAWTKFFFPGRADKYSNFHWNKDHFTATDFDEATKKTGIYRFEGKTWSRDIDDENGNADFLMGADIDIDQPEVEQEFINWGKWFIDTSKIDGFRLAAAKHVSFSAQKKWIDEMTNYLKEKYPNKNIYAVGDYWSGDCSKLLNYIDQTGGLISVFDVPLHFHMLEAATSDGKYDMSKLYQDTITEKRPELSITFADDHDTQPGQPLSSYIPPWFKPIAYTLILLRGAGTPCIFYGAYYGVPQEGVSPVSGIKKLVKIRQLYAYGEEKLYFDNQNVVGFTRSGDHEHWDSGLAVLVTNFKGGSKKMEVGKHLARTHMKDALLRNSKVVEIDDDGFGEFWVDDGAAAVWVTENAWEYLYTEIV